MPTPQPGIFVEGSTHHRLLELGVPPHDQGGLPGALSDLRAVLAAHRTVQHVVAFGPGLLRDLAPERRPSDHRAFAEIHGSAGHVAVATQADVFVWLHGAGPDVLFDAARAARRALAPAAEVVRETTGWEYRDSRDLTGFADGTENPPADEARGLAVVGQGSGAGGSFVLTQRYVHDLDAFATLPVTEQEATIGRTKPDSVELEGKPPTAHISRVVIEEDGEELEIYRRSVPYGTTSEAGLFFLAFSSSLDTFDKMLAKMYGTAGDGLHDRLMDFSRPVSGAYWFAPPVEDLDAIDSIAASRR